MGVERGLGAIGFSNGIYVQHKPRHFAPICTLCIRIKQTQVRDNVLLVVHCEGGIRRCNIGNVGIWGWFFHTCVKERMILNIPPTDRLRGLTLALFQFTRLARFLGIHIIVDKPHSM